MNDQSTYLIDKCGYLIHKWEGQSRPGFSVYLLPNGKLLKSERDMQAPFTKAGTGGFIEIMDWSGKSEWRYRLSTDRECQHHDIKMMPNGNILAVVWELKSKEEAQLAGRDSNKVSSWFWSEKIQELRPIGNDSAQIVWEWKAWDHLVQDSNDKLENYNNVKSHPELININYGYDKDYIDWLHINSIDYNPKSDQILLSARNFNEIWVIDHSTTTAEAAVHVGGRYGKGGDLLYRWGNPQAYNYGTNNEEKLFFQHNAYWIEDGYPYAGNILVFNNLNGSSGTQYASVDIIKTPVNDDGVYNNELPYAPASYIRSFTKSHVDFYAYNLSGAQILKNGSILICNGVSGLFFEIDSSKNTLWKYTNPIGMGGIIAQGTSPGMTNNVFRCTFYPADYSAFEGKDLSRKGLIENENENSNECTLFISVEDNENLKAFVIYPNPVNEFIRIETDLESFKLLVIDLQGKIIIEGMNLLTFSTKELSNGTYWVCLSTDSGEISSTKFIINR